MGIIYMHVQYKNTQNKQNKRNGSSLKLFEDLKNTLLRLVKFIP